MSAGVRVRAGAGTTLLADGEPAIRTSDFTLWFGWAGANHQIGGGGITSPLTTKGDVWGYSTTDARIPVGSDGKLIQADSGQTLGVGYSTRAIDAGSNLINNVTNPSSAQDAATKNYVDLAVAALAAKNDAQAATTAALAASTYNNGSSGVGATLTLTVAAVLVLDGYTPALNDRLLIKNQASAFQNGLYSLTTVGVLGVTQAVLTRTTDFNQPGDGINGALVYVLNGTANGNTLWSCTTDATIVFGTTNINWFQFTGTTYTADETTLHLSGTTFSIKSTYTGQASIVTVGTLTGGATGAGFTIALSSSTVTGTLAFARLPSLNGGTEADWALTDDVVKTNSGGTNQFETLGRLGGFVNPALCGPRLSYSSTLPVSGDLTSQTTLNWVPYMSDRYCVYDGTRWERKTTSNAALTLPLSSSGITCTYTTGSKTVTLAAGTSAQLVRRMQTNNINLTGAIASITDATHVVMDTFPGGNGTAVATIFKLPNATAFDVYVTWNGGTSQLQFGNSWTTSSGLSAARADTIGYQDGVLVNTAAINGSDSNGIPTKTGRYLGTIYTSGIGTGEDSSSNRYLWNYYNRRLRFLSVIDTTSSFTYSTASWQQFRAQTANQVNIVVGGLVCEDVVRAISYCAAVTTNTGGANVAVGIGIDSTSVNSAQLYGSNPVSTTGAPSMTGFYSGFPSIGQHSVKWLQIGWGTNTQTWFGGGSELANGMTVEIWA